MKKRLGPSGSVSHCELTTKLFLEATEKKRVKKGEYGTYVCAFCTREIRFDSLQLVITFWHCSVHQFENIKQDPTQWGPGYIARPTFLMGRKLGSRIASKSVFAKIPRPVAPNPQAALSGTTPHGSINWHISCQRKPLSDLFVIELIW